MDWSILFIWSIWSIWLVWSVWLILECACRTELFQFSIPLCRGVAKAALYCAHGATTVSVMFPPSSLAFSHQEGHPCWSRCGRRTRLQMIPPSLLVISQGWGLIDLPLRASNEGWFIWTISSIWLVGPEIHPEEPDRPERPANQTDEPGRVAREGGRPGYPSYSCS